MTDPKYKWSFEDARGLEAAIESARGRAMISGWNDAPNVVRADLFALGFGSFLTNANMRDALQPGGNGVIANDLDLQTPVIYGTTIEPFVKIGRWLGISAEPPTLYLKTKEGAELTLPGAQGFRLTGDALRDAGFLPILIEAGVVVVGYVAAAAAVVGVAMAAMPALADVWKDKQLREAGADQVARSMAAAQNLLDTHQRVAKGQPFSAEEKEALSALLGSVREGTSALTSKPVPSIPGLKANVSANASPLFWLAGAGLLLWGASKALKGARA